MFASLRILLKVRRLPSKSENSRRCCIYGRSQPSLLRGRSSSLASNIMLVKSQRSSTTIERSVAVALRTFLCKAYVSPYAFRRRIRTSNKTVSYVIRSVLSFPPIHYETARTVLYRTVLVHVQVRLHYLLYRTVQYFESYVRFAYTVPIYQILRTVHLSLAFQETLTPYAIPYAKLLYKYSGSGYSTCSTVVYYTRRQVAPWRTSCDMLCKCISKPGYNKLEVQAL